MNERPRIDIKAYFERIRYEGSRRPNLCALESLQLAHLGHIPFENVDVFLGRPIRLDLGSLQRKLVAASRGGYCFEQNTLFAAALRTIGFEVSAMEARVRRPGVAEVFPRTHMVLRVSVDGRDRLADVGFGGDTPLTPVSLDGTVSHQPMGDYRVVHDGPVRVLQVRRSGPWNDLYSFTGEPAYPVDFEVANHFTSTHPGSPFVQTLTTQLSKPEAVHVVRGRTYTLRSGDGERSEELSPERLGSLLRRPFGLDLPDHDLATLLSRLGSG